MATPRPEAPKVARSRDQLRWALVATLAVVSLSRLSILQVQPAGADFSCLWAGVKTALHDSARLYDFAYVTGLQGWPLGPLKLRPYIYPPSALFAFIPFALAPYWVSYGLWVAATGAAFAWAGRLARAPWWLILLPTISLVVICGQVTLLIGGLVIGGLALQRTRPVVAGVLFGVAAAIKPQIVLLVPIALMAQRRWRTLAASGVTAAGLAAASAALWGLDAWRQWLLALGRFQSVIFNDSRLVDTAITPYAALQSLEVPGAWAFLLAPLVIAGVWITFRRTEDIADRAIALFAGALMISPYAMNYEAALLAPAVASYMARTDDRRWLGYAVVGAINATFLIGVLPIATALALPVLKLWRRRPALAVA